MKGKNQGIVPDLGLECHLSRQRTVEGGAGLPSRIMNLMLHLLVLRPLWDIHVEIPSRQFAKWV